MKLPTIALVGRPNVGKSTIFNRLVGKKQAIIEDTPGVTRDRIYGTGSYYDYKFNVIDTGGIDIGEDAFNKEIKMQAEIAIEEADVVIFIVDGKEGITTNDLVVRDILRRSNKKVVVAINKVDNKKTMENIYDFYELGFDYYIPVSGSHNIGMDDLMDEATSGFKKSYDEEYSSDVVKFCVIGRPNVGKSSLVNAILNEERVIVSDVAGTTRDTVDTEFNYEKRPFVVIDTAGMRRKAKIKESIEKYSIIRAVAAVERADVCILMINAVEGITEQDTKVAGIAHEAGKAVIIAVNKWDLIEKDNHTMNKFLKDIDTEFKYLSYAPDVMTASSAASYAPIILSVSSGDCTPTFHRLPSVFVPIACTLPPRLITPLFTPSFL